MSHRPSAVPPPPPSGSSRSAGRPRPDSHFRPNRDQRPGTPSTAGFTLVELLVILALLSVVLALGVPRLRSASQKLRVTLAAHEVATLFQQTRMLAVRRNTHVAVRFTERGGGWHWALYSDGDGDGVRSRDIRDGVDPRLRGPHALRRFGTSVRPGFPEGPLPRDPAHPGRRLGRRHDPLRFGRSDLVSFGPLGTATSGSIYLSDAAGRWTAAVRLFGRTGKVKVIVYDPGTERWE